MADDLGSGNEVWAGERVTRWLRQANGLERQLAPVSVRLFATAGIRAGESVLDVGCGTGPTTREAAALAGPSARVSGLDVSGEMLAAAAAQPVGAGAPIDWIEADAVEWSAPAPVYDVVISRFGVMFFADPVAALTNLAAAARPGARLAVAVWGRRGESPMFDVPYRVTLAACTARGHEVTELADDGGPFSWHDADTVIGRLESAGWRDVAITRHVLPLPYSGGVDPAAAAAAAVDFGPTRTLLGDADEATSAAVADALTVAFADHVDAAGSVVLDAAVRIVTARR